MIKPLPQCFRPVVSMLTNTFALALNLERDSVGAVILGSYEHISEGDTAKCTKRILEVPVGEAMMALVLADHKLRHRGQVGEGTRGPIG